MLTLKNKIKLLISDFDGIFTDGKVIINSDGSISKVVSYLDVMGIYFLQRNNCKFAIISGDKAAAIDSIANRFELEDVYQDIRQKAPIVEALMAKYGLKPDEVAYIGDDVNDLEAMALVENIFTVPNANYKVKEVPNIQITSAEGGNGALRELIDTILM